MPSRIAPAQPPFPEDIQQTLDRLMAGKPPLLLFTTLARDPRLLRKLFQGGLLDRGNLTLRQRELVILRTTALNGSEYEWGVHVAIFSEAARWTRPELQSLVSGTADDACWTPQERPLLRLCDALHATSTVGDTLWTSLREVLGEEAVLEVLMLAGFYRTVSYLTNALRLPLEAGAPTFASVHTA